MIDLYLLNPVYPNYFDGEQSPWVFEDYLLVIFIGYYFLSVVRLVIVSPAGSTGLVLLVTKRYSTLLPAREWHRVSRLAFSFVTLSLRYFYSIEYVYGTLWEKYISFSPFSNS